jgi:phage protein D/phage baseplate assembly protein gpV
MATQIQLTSQAYIKINGTPLQRDIAQKIIDITVDEHTHLPDMFTVRLNDRDLELLDKGPFDLTKEIEIEGETEDGKKYSLMKGEITALEPEFGEGMNAKLVVRGYDKLHRLFRETHSKAYLNVKDSDLAHQIASKLGLQAAVDPTSTVYEHVFQHNQSDLSFLMQRAWRIGYECFISDGKLNFRKPPAPGSGVSLTWGQDLRVFRPRMTLSEQVDEVVVKGWDSANQQGIVGKAQTGDLYPKIGESKDGADWAKTFGAGKKLIVDQPVISQSEANVLAKARLDELSGGFIVAEGEAFRQPDIRAGKYVELKGLGKRLSGSYLVTGVTHIYTADGLREVFKVSGSRTGLLTEQIFRQPLDRWNGVVPALVTNTSDPQKMGRVKVKYPWLADDVESHWARVMGMGSGNDYGLCLIPAVGDEVLVTFAFGDFSQPYVLGGVWSGKNKLPKETAGASTGEESLVRTWRSSTGHVIAVYDNSDNKIEIVTSGGRSITLSDKDQKIVYKTSQVTIEVEDTKFVMDSGTDITLKAGGNLELKASGNVSIKASGSMTVEASGTLTLKGATVNIN